MCIYIYTFIHTVIHLYILCIIYIYIFHFMDFVSYFKILKKTIKVFLTSITIHFFLTDVRIVLNLIIENELYIIVMKRFLKKI